MTWTSTPVVDLQDPLSQLGHRRIDEDRLGVGVVDDVGDFVRSEVRIHRAVVQPGKLTAPGDFEELRAVRQDQRHAVAASQPRLVQQGRDALAPLEQLAVRHRPVACDDQGRRSRGPDRVVGDVHRGGYVAAPSVEAAAWRLAISDGSTLSLNTR